MRRSFVQFEIPSSLHGKTATEATICFYWAGGASSGIKLYNITQSWKSKNVTWNTQPTCSSSASATLSGSAYNWYNGNIKDLVQTWLNNDSNNHGVMLKDTNESNMSIWTTFNASESSSSNKPKLTITYSDSGSGGGSGGSGGSGSGSGSTTSYAKLVGIPSYGHDHSTCLSNSVSYLEECGYDAWPVHRGVATVSTIKSYLDDNSNKVFAIRTHGSADDPGKKMLLNDGSNVWFSYTDMNSLNLSNMKLVMFITCRSAHIVSSGQNLPQKAMNKGVKAAVGFKETIRCVPANQWTEQFFQCMKLGWTVQRTLKYLNDNPDYVGTGLDSCAIYGNGNLTLK